MGRFERVGRLSKGYQPRQVDAFVAQVEAALKGPDAGLATPATIRRAGFDLVRNGYHIAAVDAHLDLLERRALDAEASGRVPAVGPGNAFDASGLQALCERPRGDRVDRTPRLRRGYHRREVDDFLDRIALALDGRAALSVDEVRGVVFHARRGGYSEDAVDDLLDHVVETLLRQSV